MRTAWKRNSLPRNHLSRAARTLHAVDAEAVACTTRAVKDLRCASMSSAKLNLFASSLSALFAPARTVDKSCYSQLPNHQFVVSAGNERR